MSKYDPLQQHLAESNESKVTLSFAAIERIIGEALPASARRYPAWWANEEDGTHSHAQAWLDAGYRTTGLDLNASTVDFVRR